MILNTWQWAAMAVGALLVGASKTGIAGIGILAVAIFANVLPAREATGVVLPLLIVGDLLAVLMYRRHTQWRHVWGLFPWAGAGVVGGWLALGRIDDRQTARLIGAILVLMLGFHIWRRLRRGHDEVALAQAPVWVAAGVGLVAGFTTLVANAAGPVMIVYLLAMRLPKMEFVGTGAVFFMLLNWYKVPFMAQLDLITASSLHLNLWLTPFVVAGAWLGRVVLKRLDQALFERLALLLTAVAAAKLLWR